MNRDDATTRRASAQMMPRFSAMRHAHPARWRNRLVQPLQPHDLDPDTEVLVAKAMDACFEVHRILGPGFLESVYEQALGLELTDRAVPHERQSIIGVDYKGRRLGDQRLDFLIGGRVVLELKAVEALADIHTAQVLSYLKTIRCRIGLLVNFNVTLLKNGFRRVILSEGSSRRRAVAVNPS